MKIGSAEFVSFIPIGGYHLYVCPPIGLIVIGTPRQVDVSAGILISSLSATVTFTVSRDIHPAFDITVNIYSVDAVGEHIGVGLFELSRKVTGVHEYEVPFCNAVPSETDSPGHVD